MIENQTILCFALGHVAPLNCRQFDVGLFPFKINDLTLAVNPIKLREYLAAGLPVVSTPLPEVNLHEDVVEIAETAGESEAAVERCCGMNAGKRETLVATMVAETWPEKVEVIGNAVACEGLCKR